MNPRGKPPNNRDPGEYGSAAALADGLAATGRPNGTVVVTGTADGKWEFAAHPNGVGALAFDAGGKRLVVGSTAAITPGRVRDAKTPQAGNASVWDVATRQKVVELRGHTGGVLAACFSPDGKLVATASADFTACVWDAATGRQLHVLSGHLFWVRAVAFSPDGKRLATGGLDGAVKLWDTATGSGLLTLPAPTDGVTQVAFTADGTKLITSGLDGTIRVYDATPVKPTVEQNPAPAIGGY